MANAITVHRTSVPEGALACRALDRVDYVDAYYVQTGSAVRDLPEHFARTMFGHPPRWVVRLLALRDRMAAPVGLKTAAGLIHERIGHEHGGNDDAALPGLQVLVRSEDDLLFGVDDRHLDFRISIRRTGAGGGLSLVTAVKLNNWMGQLYFLPVRPLHQIVVPAMMRRATEILRSAIC